jgi:hypothetical protein
MNSNPSAVQPVASRYTDCTILAHSWEGNIKIDFTEIGCDIVD